VQDFQTTTGCGQNTKNTPDLRLLGLQYHLPGCHPHAARLAGAGSRGASISSLRTPRRVQPGRWGHAWLSRAIISGRLAPAVNHCRTNLGTSARGTGSGARARAALNLRSLIGGSGSGKGSGGRGVTKFVGRSSGSGGTNMRDQCKGVMRPA
jgi:hypothetical protein